MGERGRGLVPGVGARHAEEEEAVAHRGDDGVVAVDRRRAAAHEPGFSLPGERAPALGADVPRPASVVDLAQRREHGRARVAAHAEERAEVFAEDEPEVAQLAEEAALGLARVLFAGRAREERRLGEHGRRVDVGEREERAEELRLAAPGRADEQEPDGGAVEVVRGRRAESRIHRRGIGEPEPTLEDGDGLLDRARLGRGRAAERRSRGRIATGLSRAIASSSEISSGGRHASC